MADYRKLPGTRRSLSDNLLESRVELKRLRSEKDDVLEVGVRGIQQIVPLVRHDGRRNTQHSGRRIQPLRQIARSWNWGRLAPAGR
jgi:hypothetical protein